MPIYTYQCPACSNKFELRQGWDAEAVAPCPTCQSEAKRVLVVSSGGPISTILAEVLGMPQRGVVDLNLQTRNTGITELQAGATRIHCVSFNNVPHLDRPDRAGAPHA